MIDLKNEIEKLKDKFIEYASSLTTGRVDALDKVLDIIEDYNIITAPKTIKLSEILDRLNKEHKKTINGNIIFEYKINRNGRYNTDGTPYHIIDISIDSYHYGKKLVTAIRFTPKMTITEINFGEKHKWIYTLWIAGTEIIDDLKEE